MIFWDNFKVQNTSATITVRATTTTVGSATKSALDLGDAVLMADNLILPHGMTLPSGTTFGGSVTLPAGSAFAGSVTLPSGSGISGTLSSNQLTVSNAAITSRLTANEAVISTTISAASATVSKSLVVTGAASLPSNTIIGGSKLLPGPRQVNLLYVDGHFGKNQDWVSVENLSTSPIYLFVELYLDAQFQNPYRVNGNIVTGHITTPLQPGTSRRILEFTDDNYDSFAKENGYVRIKYSLNSEITDASGGNDINEKVRANDLTGANDKYVTYGSPTGPAAWLRTVLYQSDKEHWYVVNCSTPDLFANMCQTMQSEPYYCNYAMILGGQEIGHGGWQSINSLSHFYGGVIGFKSVDE